MLRIIVLCMLIFLCPILNSQEISKNKFLPNKNRFDFIAEIAAKVKSPVKTYSQLYSDFIKRKLKKENPESNAEVLDALSNMIASPENKIVITDDRFNKNEFIYQYYKALLLVANKKNKQATKILNECLKKAVKPGYTRLFILIDLKRLNNNRLTGNKARALLEKIILTECSANEDARFLYKITFSFSESFLISLNKKIKDAQQVNQWLRLLIQGQVSIKSAWSSRGNGWASAVTKEGWEGFYANLKDAEKFLNKAWEINPNYPEAPTLMITVSMGHGSINDRIKWFRRAIEAQFNYYPPYIVIENSIAPKWGGSNKLRKDLIVACLRYGRLDTDVPEYGIRIALNIAENTDDYRWQSIFINQDVCLALLEYINSKAKLAKSKNAKDEALTLLVMANIYTLNYEKAKEIYKKLSPSVFNKKINELRKRRVMIIPAWIDLKSLVSIFTGKNIFEFCKIQKKFATGKKTDAMLNLFKLIAYGELNQKEKMFAIDLLGRMRISKKACVYNDLGPSALNVGIFYNFRPAFIKRMIKLGINCNVLTQNTNRTSLMIASRKSETEFANLLKDAGVNLNQKDKYGWTALQHAIYKRNLPFTKRLIELGADVNTINNNEPLLLTALLSKRDKAVKLLLESGADVNIRVPFNNCSLLMRALSKNLDLFRLEKILNQKIDLELRGNHGWTAIGYAICYYKDPKATNLLIQKGANVNIKDVDGDTPLIAASAWSKSSEKMKMLIKAGADINAANNSGRTPLIMAIISKRPLEEIKILVENGAKLNVVDSRGSTAYDWANKNKQKDIVEYLKGNGALTSTEAKKNK